MGIPVNQKNYTQYEDQHKLAAEDLSTEQRQYDHTDLGWINMLRIGMIWVDIKVQYQKFYEI